MTQTLPSPICSIPAGTSSRVIVLFDDGQASQIRGGGMVLPAHHAMHGGKGTRSGGTTIVVVARLSSPDLMPLRKARLEHDMHPVGNWRLTKTEQIFYTKHLFALSLSQRGGCRLWNSTKKESYGFHMSEQYPRAALFGTEERTIFSTIRGREYHLSVALPDSYKTSTAAYPVIYVLDGDFHFGLAAGLTGYSNWFRNVPELIIVGIGYAMETTDEFVVQLRDLDYDVPGMPGAASGSAANLFLDALTQEIIPFINANYRTIPDGSLPARLFVERHLCALCVVPAARCVSALYLRQRDSERHV